MKTIFIIQNEVGEYEDHREEVLCAATTEDKAEALVQQFIEWNKFNTAFADRMREEFRRPWEYNNPRPVMPIKPKPPAGFHELQRALSAAPGAEFAEMKASYRKLQDQHNENLKIYTAEIDAWHKQLNAQLEAFKAAEAEWFNKNYILPSHLSEVEQIAHVVNHTHNWDNQYTHYELTLLQ